MAAKDGPIDLLVNAVGENPRQVRLSSTLADFYAKTGSVDKGEKVLKDLVEKAGDDPDASSGLAHYYQDYEGKSQEAIKEYNEVLAHPVPGGGIAAKQNIVREIESRFGIAWGHMDVAQQAGVRTQAGKDALASAADWNAKLRSSLQTPRDWQDLADGRLPVSQRQHARGADRPAACRHEHQQGGSRVSSMGAGQETFDRRLRGFGPMGQRAELPRSTGRPISSIGGVPSGKGKSTAASRWKEALQLVESLAKPSPEDDVPAPCKRRRGTSRLRPIADWA